MAAGTYNFEWDQGATFDTVMRWLDQTETPIDLTGWAARMHLRTAVDSPDVVLALTTENGRIELDGASGNIRLLVSATDTAAVVAGSYRYDLELVLPNVGATPTDYVRKLLKGKVKVLPEVTR